MSEPELKPCEHDWEEYASFEGWWVECKKCNLLGDKSHIESLQKRIDELELLTKTQDTTIKALTATCKEQEKEIISLHHALEKMKNEAK